MMILTMPVAPGDSIVPQRDCRVDGDAADSPEGARPIVVGHSCPGAIEADETEDWYTLPLVQGSMFDAHISPSTGQLIQSRLCVFGPDLAPRGTCGTFRRTVIDATGDWYLRVWRVSGPRADYSLGTAHVPIVHNDCGSGRDASAEQPVIATLGVNCQLSFPEGASDAEDVVLLDVPPSELLKIALVASGSTTNGCLYDPDGSLVTCTRNLPDLRIHDPKPGTWRVVATSGATLWGTYRVFAVLINDPAQDDCGTGADAPPGTVLALPVSCTGFLNPLAGDGEDRYSFQVAAGDVVDVPTIGDVTLCLRRPDGTNAACGDQGTGVHGHVRAYATVAGLWSVSVSARYARETPYTLSVTSSPFVAPEQDDCGSGHDADAAAPPALTLPAACSGTFPAASPDVLDVYAFQAAQGQTIFLTVTPTAGSTQTCLRDPTGVDAFCGTPSFGLRIPADVGGTWTLRVAPTDWRADYDLALDVRTTQDDCGAGRDAGGSHASALLLPGPAGAACQGAFPPGDRDVSDWYAIDLPVGAVLSAALVNDPLFDFDLCSYAPGSTTPHACTSTRVWSPEHLEHAVDEAGAWRVAVWKRTGSGNYTLALGAI